MKRSRREQVSREILEYLLVGGVITLAISTPYILAPAILIARFQKRQYPKRKFQNSFYYLRRNGLITVESRKGKVHISLTEKGKKRVLQDSLLTSVKVKKPRRWDKKWRAVLFDIESNHDVKRNALRSILRKVGFVQLQKSVWIYPHDCQQAIGQLKEFFGLSEEECRLVVSGDIGGDQKFRRHFEV